MADCLSPQALQSFVSKDVNRIVGEIIAATARFSPYLDILPSGTFPNNFGTNVRAVVQEPTVVAASLTVPTYTAEASM